MFFALMMHFFALVCTSHKKTLSSKTAGDKIVDSIDWLANVWWLYYGANRYSSVDQQMLINWIPEL